MICRLLVHVFVQAGKEALLEAFPVELYQRAGYVQVAQTSRQ